MSRVLVVVSDLFFSVKILDAAKRSLIEAAVVTTQEDLRTKAAERPALVVFDLNFAQIEPIRMIGELRQSADLQGMGIIAFVSHVQADLKKQAQDAGCDMVFARSAFAQHIPEILKRYGDAV